MILIIEENLKIELERITGSIDEQSTEEGHPFPPITQAKAQTSHQNMMSSITGSVTNLESLSHWQRSNNDRFLI